MITCRIIIIFILLLVGVNALVAGSLFKISPSGLILQTSVATFASTSFLYGAQLVVLLFTLGNRLNV